MIWSDEAYYSHAGYNALFLCTLDGKDYLLRYNPWGGQGSYSYSYKLFTLSKSGEERTVKENSVEFDTSFWGSEPLHGRFDPDAINAYLTEINDLLAHSVVLINTDDELISSFEDSGARLYHVPLWLRGAYNSAPYDPSKSLLENLRDFQAAMEAEAAPEIQETEVEGEYLLTYGGMEKRFTAVWDSQFQNGPAAQLLDLNGDGRDEIVVILNAGHGTGALAESLCVFDADTLEQYDTSRMPDMMIEQISSTADETNFYLSAPGMEKVTIPKSTFRMPSYDTIQFGGYSYYTVKDGKLFCWQMGYGNFYESCGQISAELKLVNGEIQCGGFVYEPNNTPYK